MNEGQFGDVPKNQNPIPHPHEQVIAAINALFDNPGEHPIRLQREDGTAGPQLILDVHRKSLSGEQSITIFNRYYPEQHVDVTWWQENGETTAKFMLNTRTATGDKSEGLYAKRLVGFFLEKLNVQKVESEMLAGDDAIHMIEAAQKANPDLSDEDAFKLTWNFQTYQKFNFPLVENSLRFIRKPDDSIDSIKCTFHKATHEMIPE